MAKKYFAYFHEYRERYSKPNSKTIFIGEHMLNSDSRAMTHQRTGKKETREISKEEFDKLNKVQKSRIMVREVEEKLKVVNADVNGDGKVDQQDLEDLKEVLAEAESADEEEKEDGE